MDYNNVLFAAHNTLITDFFAAKIRGLRAFYTTLHAFLRGMRQFWCGFERGEKGSGLYSRAPLGRSFTLRYS